MLKKVFGRISYFPFLRDLRAINKAISLRSFHDFVFLNRVERTLKSRVKPYTCRTRRAFLSVQARCKIKEGLMMPTFWNHFLPFCTTRRSVYHKRENGRDAIRDRAVYDAPLFSLLPGREMKTILGGLIFSLGLPQSLLKGRRRWNFLTVYRVTAFLGDSLCDREGKPGNLNSRENGESNFKIWTKPSKKSW